MKLIFGEEKATDDEEPLYNYVHGQDKTMPGALKAVIINDTSHNFPLRNLPLEKQAAMLTQPVIG